MNKGSTGKEKAPTGKACRRLNGQSSMVHSPMTGGACIAKRSKNGQWSIINGQWSPYRDEEEREPSRLPSLRQVIIHEPHRLVKVSPEQERISPVEATLKE